MTAPWHVFGRCKTFTESYNGVTATVTLTRPTVSGQPAGIEAVELSPIYCTRRGRGSRWFGAGS